MKELLAEYQAACGEVPWFVGGAEHRSSAMVEKSPPSGAGGPLELKRRIAALSASLRSGVRPVDAARRGARWAGALPLTSNART